ncbi:MAG: hypothetical protein GMKNLPBB_01285 [Myxococcota bacterium]|nr:hypothetical protein [Myxococcota bacterium]
MFPIPIRDTTPPVRRPVVTPLLIGACVAVFAAQLASGLEESIGAFAFVPAEITGYADLGERNPWFHGPWTILTSMFMHGGIQHIVANMLYLYIFGDNVEGVMGRFRYLLFYLLCGGAATLAHLWADPSSAVPLVGASGAISGVLGGYLLLYPHSRVVMMWWFFLWVRFFVWPAWFTLGLYFFLQVLFVWMSDGQGGVAYWAHIGGFAMGLLLTVPFMAGKHWPHESARTYARWAGRRGGGDDPDIMWEIPRRRPGRMWRREDWND